MKRDKGLNGQMEKGVVIFWKYKINLIGFFKLQSTHKQKTHKPFPLLNNKGALMNQWLVISFQQK